MTKKKSNKNETLFFLILGILCIAIVYIIINDIIVGIKIKQTVASGKSTLKSGPIQKIIPENKRETIDFKGAKIKKIATYDITGVVIGMEYFYFGGGANTISPEDLVLAWGPASNRKYMNDISVKIGANDRFASYSIIGDFHNDYKEKATNYISNNHIIPMNNRLKSVLKKIRKGDVVQILGYLVDCKGNNWTWGPSSMTRTDKGNGACEIILAESIYILEN